MKVIFEIWILKYLFFVTLASPRANFGNFPDFPTEEKSGDYDIKEKSNDYQNFDRRSDYVTYYLRNPFKDDRLYQEDYSFDSTIESMELLGNKYSNENKHSKKYKPQKTSEKTSNQKHKKNKNSNSDSSESNDESESHSHENNLNRKKNDRISNKQRKINFDNSNDLESIENDSRENSSEEFSQSLEQNKIQNIKTSLSKKDKSKIISLLKKLSKSSSRKQLSDSKNSSNIDVDTIYQEPIYQVFKKWRKVKNIIKLLLVDNYKYVEKILLSEIINNKQTSRNQISRLEVKLLQKYYLLKKDIFQTVKVAKKKLKEDISKEKLSEKKIHDVEQLYYTQLENQIVNKIFTFKQDIKSEIDQFQLELKSVDYAVNQNMKSTAIQKETNATRPFDSLSGNEPIIDEDINLSSAFNIISAGDVISLEIIESSLTENKKNINHSDTLTHLNSVSRINENRVTVPSDSELLKNTQKSSNVKEVNDSVGESIRKGNEDTDFIEDGQTPSFNIDNLAELDTSSKVTIPAIVDINKNMIETEKAHGSPIENTVVIDNNNLQEENLTTIYTDYIAATTKNEIDTNLRNNSTKPITAAVSDDAGSSSLFTHLHNTTHVKNIATGKNVTSDAGNSSKFNKLSQIDHPETSLIDNDKLIEPLSDSHVAGNDLLVNQHLGVTNVNSIVKNQINDLEQHNLIHIPNHVQESQDDTLINNQIGDAKVAQKPSEANTDSTQSNIMSAHESNRSTSIVNDTYDSPKYESIFNITNVDENLVANSSINEYSTTITVVNEISESTSASNIEIFNNLDRKNQVQTISTNATEDVNKRKSITPIDGNIENVSAQSNLDLIPYDVNTENIQSTSDVNTIPKINVIPTKLDINSTDDYEATKSIDDNFQSEHSHALINAETTFELQNVKENIIDSEKQQDVNDIANEFNTTSYHYQSLRTAPLNNSDQVNLTHNETAYNRQTENTTLNIYSNDNSEVTETIINSYSTSSDFLVGASGSILNENKNINITDISVTQTTPAENITRKSKDLNIRNGTATNINQLIENQNQKTTQMNPSKNDSQYYEATTLYSAKVGQEPLNKNIFNDTIKVPNETSAITSNSYIKDEITANPTKILDSNYHAIDTTISLDITTDKDFYTESKVEETANANKIISTTIITLPENPQSLQSIFDEPITSTIIIEKSSTDIIMEEANMSTTIMPENKINTSDCTDATGAIVDCESLILSSSGNNISKNAGIENKKPTMNMWPGVPQACLSLFLASDGNVLKEIPLTDHIANAQTRNLCLSIAKTIIQLNDVSNVK